MPKKDWAYYKREYVDRQTYVANYRMKLIERRIESPIERIAFLYLTNMISECFDLLEVDIRDQVNIGPYRVDILVSHHDSETNIVIECDGHDFHEKTKEQAARDKKRDRFLTKLGFIVLRYTGSQICNNPQEIYDDVSGLIYERKLSTKDQ